MLPDLYLMRHGETEWNRQGRMQGRLDSALTDRGVEQARRQAQLIAEIDGTRYASPQGRAMQTAEIVFAGQPFTDDDRLCEIDVGTFAGRMFDDLRLRHPDLFTGAPHDWYDRTPEGENFARLEARCQDFLSALRAPSLIITHGITLRMLRILALGQPVARIGDLTVEQGAVHVIRNGAYEIWR